MYCKQCYYCLENLEDGAVCPECGDGFDPMNSNTYTQASRTFNRFLLYLVAAVNAFLIGYTYMLYFHTELIVPSNVGMGGLAYPLLSLFFSTFAYLYYAGLILYYHSKWNRIPKHQYYLFLMISIGNLLPAWMAIDIFT